MFFVVVKDSYNKSLENKIHVLENGIPFVHSMQFLKCSGYCLSSNKSVRNCNDFIEYLKVLIVVLTRMRGDRKFGSSRPWHKRTASTQSRFYKRLPETRVWATIWKG